MYSRVQLAFKYISWYFSASNGKGHGTHSPFVFDFITNVLNDKTKYPDYRAVEELRHRMLANKELLTYGIFGAGTFVSSAGRTLSSVASSSAKPKKYGQLLYRMVRKYQPQTTLELGTSLGITSSYLAKGNLKSRFIT